MITGALSMALSCKYVDTRGLIKTVTRRTLDTNRILKADEVSQIKPRILILSLSPDSPVQYIPLMNCIFSAQKAVSASYQIIFCTIADRDFVLFRVSRWMSAKFTERTRRSCNRQLT